MDTRLTPLENTKKTIDTAGEIVRLAKMTVTELRTRHVEVFGGPAKSYHKEYLTRLIAWQLQADAEGGLPEETRQLALAIARDAPLRIRIGAPPRAEHRTPHAPPRRGCRATTTPGCRCRAACS